MQLTARLVRLAAKSWTIYRFVNSDVRVEVPWTNATLRVPVYGRTGHWNLSFAGTDSDTVAVLRRILSVREGAVIDVGANLGRFLIYLSTLDRDRPYLGIEPSATCCVYLQRLIRSNKLTHHRVLACALADYDGTAILASNDEQDVFATTTPSHYPPDFFRETSIVPCLRGDEAIAGADLGQVALLKVDVEGGELEVLRGFEQTIRRYQPIFLIEVAPADRGHVNEDVISARRRRSLEMTRFIESIGYTYRVITKGGELPAHRDGAPLGTQSTLEYMDYVCVSQSDESALRELERG